MGDDMEIDDEDKEIDDGEYDTNDDDDDDDEDNEENERLDETDIGKMYKYAHNKTEFSDDEDEDEGIEEILDDDNKHEQTNILSGDDRITKAVLTKYERVRLLEDRTKQLSLGAKPMIKNVEDLPARKVAELELKYDVIPLIIVRPLPNNLREKWKISELAH